MKRILFYFILTIGLISCGIPSEVTLPDKNITTTGDILDYKDKPYTGKIIVNIVEKIQGYEGFITFKDGHLEGLSDLKNTKKNQQIKFNIINGKFEGDVIMNDPEQGITMNLNIKKGIITKIAANLTGPTPDNTLKYELTFHNGLANGTMEMGKQKLDFKDGLAKLTFPQGTLDIKLSINPETGDITTESIQNGKSLQKKEVPNQLTPSYLEKFIFTEITRIK